MTTAYAEPVVMDHAAWQGWSEMLPEPSLVAVSHGTGDPAGRSATRGLVDAVDAAMGTTPVHDAFVDVEHPRVGRFVCSEELGPDAAAALVPLLLSAGTHASGDLADAAALRPGTRVALPLGPASGLAIVLRRRLLEAGWVPGEAVILACAGSTDPAGVADCRTMAQRLAGHLQVPVTAAFISAAEPRLGEAINAARTRNPRVRTAVATYLLAPGYFADLAAACTPDVLGKPLLVPGENPPQELVDLVIKRYRQAIA
ncbi:sirohydrochlorin chelatase [Paeniglutamicibacter kerguelensis]|uniref:Sirohydrochlorin ferrochelatase n=1 Tax=Paeniglutamicibacter kerguelensis TaxID=254788 RepID=A0ABS4XGV3_9MICC|nr:CbiX/SirB N-terminal domain-containing protein [Paeniglutamicibacter kerguelensis]MBP2387705.1 sirohydrochlorin ferrochelatase [Paeniglutamicibacter kerguelensis]